MLGSIDKKVLLRLADFGHSGGGGEMGGGWGWVNPLKKEDSWRKSVFPNRIF